MRGCNIMSDVTLCEAALNFGENESSAEASETLWVLLQSL